MGGSYRRPPEGIDCARHEEQKRKWLVPLTEGKMESGFSMTEPDSAGSDPHSIKTTARREPSATVDRRPVCAAYECRL